MSASKNKPKFDTAHADVNSNSEHSEGTGTPGNARNTRNGSVLTNPVVSGVLQSLGNYVNTDVVNNLVGQVHEFFSGQIETVKIKIFAETLHMIKDSEIGSSNKTQF